MQYVLKAHSLEKKYISATETVYPIRNVSFEVYPKDFILIYGPSGSGKTTLLNLLSGIDRPNEGTIWFNDLSYKGLSDFELTKLRRFNMGVIFQSFELIPVISCFENIEYPLLYQGIKKDIRKKKIKEIASLLEVEDLLNRKPSQISGGQKQRIAICRALVGNYDIILGDEITGSLDPLMSERVYALLKNMSEKEGKTFVLVTHNIELKKYASKVYHLVQGCLEEELK